MKIGNGEFWLGDCLELMQQIPDGSVDMILCDLPYGTTQNKWDSVIPFEPLWSHYWRVCKPNAAVVLTAAQPFDKTLGASQIEHYQYEWIWEKARPVGHLNAKRRPMGAHENVLVFHRSQPIYNAQGLVACEKVNRRSHSSTNYGSAGTSNVAKWTNYPRSVIKFAHDGGGLHPTQKPVALFEYLIKTYTDPDMLVLDNCAGSGTTAIAAERTGRRWLCIEREPSYYYPAVGRVWSEVHE